MCLNLSIHPIAPRWEAELAALFERLASAEETRFFLPHPLTDEEARRIAHRTGHDLYAIMLYEDRAIAYGLLRGWDDGYEVPSLGISVHPHFRGSGVGATMMQYLHVAATLRQSPKIRLRVAKDNDRAQRMYLRLGYEFTEDDGAYLTGFLDLRKYRPTREAA